MDLIARFFPAAFIAGISLIILFSGTLTRELDSDTPVSIEPIEAAKVSVSRVRSGSFGSAGEVTGKISHERKAVLRFAAGGVIAGLNAEEGQRVKLGEKLAWVDTLDAFLDFRAAVVHKDLAILRKNELLITYGGDAFAENSVDSLTLRSINLQSNFDLAAIEKEKRWRNLRDKYLMAPFEGIIANVSVQSGEYAAPGTKVADLFDESAYLVKFNWLYSKIGQVKHGETVEVTTLSGEKKSWIAKVLRINPQVDDHGMVQVTARFTGGGARIFPEGLVVKVVVPNRQEAKLIVPATALIKRNGQDAVFLLDTNKSISVFSPVEILNQSYEELEVRGNFQPGALVLTAGHLFLKQGSEVIVVNQKAD